MGAVGVQADLQFGIEPVTIGDVTKHVDVCRLANDLFDAWGQVPKDVVAINEVEACGPHLNAVLDKHGLPPFKVHVQVYKFTQDIMNRALDIKKAACSVLASADEPALQPGSPDFE